MSKQKKTVLITGGAMGQGRAHAVKYAQNGFNVVLADMLDPEDERFQETIKELNELGATTLAAKGKTAAAGKLIAIMSMGVKQGDEVTVQVEGPDEDAAFEALEKFFQENL